jgi:choline-sulfatase
VLLITIDTLRADALGAYGNATGATPWMDRLAAGGVRFDSAHAQNVVTLPSHANILSGRYPFVHGVRDNAGFRFPQSMDTLATILKARGYRTGAFVSAFPLDARFGLGRGFDEYDDRLSEAARPAFLEQERAGTDTVARARAWLGDGSSQPSLCWVHLYEPHFPYAPPEPFASRFQHNLYAGEVAAADAALGPLLEPILGAGAQGHTVVVLTADHGESLDEHGEATHGIFAYEATLRVPLILYAPRGLTPAVRRDFVRHIDILPSVLDLLSIPAPSSLDGHSLLSKTRPQADSDRSYFEALSGTLNRGWAPLHGVIDHGLKYIDLPIPELYDLAADPGEQHNLADARPADVKGLKSRVAQFPEALPQAAAEDAATSGRLRSLGYVSGRFVPRSRYTAADDPKRLIGIDRELQQIVDLYVRGDSTAVLDRARGFAKRQPSMPIAWLQLAHLERESGNLPGAIDALRRAHALNPSNTQVTALLGGYLTQAGRAQEAVTLLAPYAARPDADVDVLTTLALARARLGAPDEALAFLARAKAEDPGSAMLLVNEGTIQLIAGRRDAARSAFDQALARDPSSPRAHSSLAAMAIDDGRIDEALSQWRAAVAADPGEYATIFALGVGHARSDRAIQARACLQFFADHAPSGRWATEIAQARSWLSAHP